VGHNIEDLCVVKRHNMKFYSAFICNSILGRIWSLSFIEINGTRKQYLCSSCHVVMLIGFTG
jgi:hypothetical protein